MAESDPDTYPTPEEYWDHEGDEGPEDAKEWQPGECDNCDGPPRTDAEKLAALGSSIVPVCACWIGQGASPEDCTCGRPE